MSKYLTYESRKYFAKQSLVTLTDNMASLDSITAADVAKAVRQTQECLNITIGELVPLTEDLYPATLELLKECFINEEPVCTALGVDWCEEYRNSWLAIFRANLSFVLIDKTSGELMGVRLILGMKKGTSEDFVNPDEIEDKPRKHYVQLMQISLKMAKFFEKYDADEAFLLWGLAVPSKYQQRGIATLMMKAAVTFIECLGFESVYIRGNASSNYSRRIYENLNFETLSEISFDTYCVDGEFILKGKTGVHTCLKEYVLLLQKTILCR